MFAAHVSPSCRSATRCTMANPMPLPGRVRAVGERKNRSNTCSKSASGIPSPASQTSRPRSVTACASLIFPRHPDGKSQTINSNDVLSEHSVQEQGWSATATISKKAARSAKIRGNITTNVDFSQHHQIRCIKLQLSIPWNTRRYRSATRIKWLALFVQSIGLHTTTSEDSWTLISQPLH